MIEHGLYFIKPDLGLLIKRLGGEWNDPKHRPVVCLVKSSESDKLYWAVPMGNLSHRSKEQIDRIQTYMSYPDADIRSCFYHIGKTTTKSIFFVSDAVPVTDTYVERAYLGYGNNQFVIKNLNLLHELQRKLFRILTFENKRSDYFRQHITTVKNYLLAELKFDTKSSDFPCFGKSGTRSD